MSTVTLIPRHEHGNRFVTFAFSLFMVIIFVISTGTEVYGERKLPVIVITVDVESTSQENSPLPLTQQVDAVCIGKMPCGLQEMVNILKKRGYAATFFLNVFEYAQYGEAFLERTGKWLHDSGQDVQLHTHPQWRYDRSRTMMYQYTLEEQVKMIRDGKRLLEKWTGARVIAHRAGSYSADENTLKALVANNILIDSSLFYGVPDSRINSLGLNKNAMSMYGPLYEFPVTVYKKNEYLFFTGDPLRPQSSIRKYDINWFRDQEEAESAIREAVRLKMEFIILFLHSFSFIKGQSGAQMIADENAIGRFDRVLEFISTQGMEVSTFDDVANGKLNWAALPLDGQDVVPEISQRIPLIQYIRKMVGINRHNYKSVIFYCTLFLASVALAATIVAKRRMNRNAR